MKRFCTREQLTHNLEELAMSVDYKKQYRPDQLEPFWPNELVKMAVVVLCTLAVIMFLAVLPMVLDMLGFTGVMHVEEPADPRGATPLGIKPEWYFLAVYQHLKLMPTQLLGISGKTIGVLSQGPVMMVLLLLPFWYRRGAHRRPGNVYRAVITLVVFGFLGMTLWGGWPEQHGGENEGQLVSLASYISHQPMIFALIGVTLVAFFVMISHERTAIRRIMDSEPGQQEDKEVGT